MHFDQHRWIGRCCVALDEADLWELPPEHLVTLTIALENALEAARVPAPLIAIGGTSFLPQPD